MLDSAIALSMAKRARRKGQPIGEEEATSSKPSTFQTLFFYRVVVLRVSGAMLRASAVPDHPGTAVPHG